MAAALRVSFEQVVLAHGAPEAARAIALHVLAQRDARGGLHSGAGPVGLPARDGGPGAAHPRPGGRRGAHRPRPRVGGPRRGSSRRPAGLDAGDREQGRGPRRHGPRRPSRPPGRTASAWPRPHIGPARRLLVDVSLSVGALPVDVGELGADALIGEVQHWLLGPRGWPSPGWPPPSGWRRPQSCAPPAAPSHRGPLLALARSVGWLLMYVELPWVVARTGRLARRLYDSLATIGGVELLAERSRHGPLLAFRVARLAGRAGRRGALAQLPRHHRRGRRGRRAAGERRCLEPR